VSMSTHVVGIKPPDETWLRMKAAWDACRTADVDPPKEVEKFFNYEVPDDAGVRLNQEALGDAIKVWEDDSRDGYEIDVTKLPKDVKIVRVYNSY
jgi:hypothetical protein